MTFTQLWGCLLIMTAMPLLGAFVSLPQGRNHASRQLIWDMLLGLGAIALTRYFFPPHSPWELITLLALTMGRYWRRQEISLGLVWGGLLLHDWQITLTTSFIGVISLTLFRQVYLGTWAVLALVFVALGLRHGTAPGYWGAAIALGGVLGWLSQRAGSQRQLWQLFQPEYGFLNLDQPLMAAKVGQDAATLSQLKALGYPVLPGWILRPGDDLQRFLTFLEPKGDRPYMVRLSSEKPALTFHIPTESLRTSAELEAALVNGFSNADLGRQALLIQAQPSVLWSGITYSRPPLPYSRQDPLTEVARDFITPLVIGEGRFPIFYGLADPQPLGEVSAPEQPPQTLLRDVAQLSRQLEKHQGSPQAMEWCFTGEQLWILRVRPVYHLHPVWTREWIGSLLPQPLSPLSASLLETIVPGAIASLYTALWEGQENPRNITFISHHRGYSYLNRSFWERLWHRKNFNVADLQSRTGLMGLMLRHPMLCYRYLRWDWQWYGEFQGIVHRFCYPLLKTLKMIDSHPTALGLADRVHSVEQITDILELLLGFWLRGEVILWRKRLTSGLPNFLPPLPPRVQTLNQLAVDIRAQLKAEGKVGRGHREPLTRAALFAQLAELPDGDRFFERLDQWIADYSDGAALPWELAQKRWRENTGAVRQWLTDLVNQPRTAISPVALSAAQRQLQQTHLQQEEVASFYEMFLAQLRQHLLAIAQMWQKQGYLEQPDDIFWLKLSEVKTLTTDPGSQDFSQLQLKIQYRRSQLSLDQEQGAPPDIIYGQLKTKTDVSSSCSLQKLQGQAVSSGAVIGQVRFCPQGQLSTGWSANDILVTSYIHEGDLAMLPQVGGIITTQGGVLSQGASLARQHHIPMVANVAVAFDSLQPGQWVRLDGRLGQVELLDPGALSTDAN
ncbi:hypothetical protein NIES970_09760 [[Synechococcus] sp. NIES-970]|nr:hypothetical protein NIES970_09760 [[Synechococcus] sp. NIES-970]